MKVRDDHHMPGKAARHREGTGGTLDEKAAQVERASDDYVRVVELTCDQPPVVPTGEPSIGAVRSHAVESARENLEPRHIHTVSMASGGPITTPRIRHERDDAIEPLNDHCREKSGRRSCNRDSHDHPRPAPINALASANATIAWSGNDRDLRRDEEVAGSSLTVGGGAVRIRDRHSRRRRGKVRAGLEIDDHRARQVQAVASWLRRDRGQDWVVAEVGPGLGRPLVDTLRESNVSNLKELRPRSGRDWPFA